MQPPGPNSESTMTPGTNSKPPAPGANSGTPQGPNSEPPAPPEALKPWYYQSWFLVPTFVWWPCSAILFIRSPWHNGVVSGALSWAWIIIGGGWIFLRMQYRWRNDADLLDPTLLALVAPGVVLTIITQWLWLRRDRPYIRRLRAAGRFAEFENGVRDDSPSGRPPSASSSASGRRTSATSSPTAGRRRGGGRRRRRR